MHSVGRVVNQLAQSRPDHLAAGLPDSKNTAVPTNPALFKTSIILTENLFFSLTATQKSFVVELFL